MRLRNNKFAMWLVAYFLLGLLVLIFFQSVLPSILSKILATTLFISFFLIPAIWFHEQAKEKRNLEDRETKHSKKRAMIFSIIFCVLVGGYVFVAYFIPLM